MKDVVPGDLDAFERQGVTMQRRAGGLAWETAHTDQADSEGAKPKGTGNQFWVEHATQMSRPLLATHRRGRLSSRVLSFVGTDDGSDVISRLVTVDLTSAVELSYRPYARR